MEQKDAITYCDSIHVFHSDSQLIPQFKLIRKYGQSLK